MADEPKTPPAASASDLQALAARVKTLEGQVEKLMSADAGGQLKGHAKRLDALERGAEPAKVYAWRHRDTGAGARIIDQGNATVYEDEAGDAHELPTHEFNRLFEDATAL